MLPRLRVSIGALMAAIVVCAVAAWLFKGWLYPNRVRGQRFALIGPLDIDRDGRDDRDRLRRMIVRNGGSVDYDLPTTGPSSGKVGPLTAYYVDVGPPRGSSVPARFLAERAAAVAEARSDGVRPLTIKQLLARLGMK